MSNLQSQPRPDAGPDSVAPVSWEEQRLWHKAGVRWHQLHGSIHELGVSFEWHEFKLGERLDWSRSFHPGVLELCLNLEGEGSVQCGGDLSQFRSRTVGFYAAGKGDVQAWREPGQTQRFLCVEFSPGFLRSHLGKWGKGLHPVVRGVIAGQPTGALGPTRALSSEEWELVRAIRRPPVLAAAQPAWYMAKALELGAAFFYEPPPQEELFCHRQQHVAAARVARVIALLKENLATPPSLSDIGKSVGCSPFYLSRTFSGEVGMTIPQYIRQLRMDRAAELLSSGKFNVTEAALEVGYNSLSHFSHAFHQTFGCCPGLYPVIRPQKK